MPLSSPVYLLPSPRTPTPALSTLPLPPPITKSAVWIIPSIRLVVALYCYLTLLW